MKLDTSPYSEQAVDWPHAGRNILAHYDASSIVVYQAYRPSIGHYAIKHGHLGGEFSYSRMSWIKPNFLWMMYRSGWGSKPGQDVTLALRLSRRFFEEILAQAVHSSYNEHHHTSREEWKVALSQSEVRLQWDPDHCPRGTKLERRALQLGLRGSVLKAFGTEQLLEVIDMSEFVALQRKAASTPGYVGLETPVERVYRPEDKALCARLGLQDVNAQQEHAADG